MRIIESTTTISWLLRKRRKHFKLEFHVWMNAKYKNGDVIKWTIEWQLINVLIESNRSFNVVTQPIKYFIDKENKFFLFYFLYYTMYFLSYFFFLISTSFAHKLASIIDWLTFQLELILHDWLKVFSVELYFSTLISKNGFSFQTIWFISFQWTKYLRFNRNSMWHKTIKDKTTTKTAKDEKKLLNGRR